MTLQARIAKSQNVIRLVISSEIEESRIREIHDLQSILDMVIELQNLKAYK